MKYYGTDEQVSANEEWCGLGRLVTVILGSWESPFSICGEGHQKSEFFQMYENIRKNQTSESTPAPPNVERLTATIERKRNDEMKWL